MSEKVNHPSWYNKGRIEVIEFLEDKNLDFHRANAVKYICRAGIKDQATEIEDLQKAVWYLNRRIELLRARETGQTPARPNDMNPREIDDKIEIITGARMEPMHLKKGLVREPIGT